MISGSELINNHPQVRILRKLIISMVRLICYLSMTVLLCAQFLACQMVKFSKNPEILIPKISAPKKPLRFALVLGGGGARGLAHIGVLEKLEEEGIKPDLIIGCSAGAIVGALYASNPDTKWLKEILLSRQAADFLAFHTAQFPFAVLSNSGLESFLKKHLGNRRFQDLKIPFVAVATNLQTGSLIPFFTGPLVKPILASSAVPGAFSPVYLYDTYFVDGGVADPVPVQTARDLNAEIVVAVEVGQQLSNEAPTNMLGIMWRSMVINYAALSKQNARRADVAIDVPIPEVGIFSDSQNWELYALGRSSAEVAMAEIKGLLAKTKADNFKSNRKIR